MNEAYGKVVVQMIRVSVPSLNPHSHVSFNWQADGWAITVKAELSDTERLLIKKIVKDFTELAKENKGYWK